MLEEVLPSSSQISSAPSSCPECSSQGSCNTYIQIPCGHLTCDHRQNYECLQCGEDVHSVKKSFIIDRLFAARQWTEKKRANGSGSTPILDSAPGGIDRKPLSLSTKKRGRPNSKISPDKRNTVLQEPSLKSTPEEQPAKRGHRYRRRSNRKSNSKEPLETESDGTGSQNCSTPTSTISLYEDVSQTATPTLKEREVSSPPKISVASKERSKRANSPLNQRKALTSSKPPLSADLQPVNPPVTNSVVSTPPKVPFQANVEPVATNRTLELENPLPGPLCEPSRTSTVDMAVNDEAVPETTLEHCPFQTPGSVATVDTPRPDTLKQPLSPQSIRQLSESFDQAVDQVLRTVRAVQYSPMEVQTLAKAALRLAVDTFQSKHVFQGLVAVSPLVDCSVQTEEMENFDNASTVKLSSGRPITPQGLGSRKRLFDVGNCSQKQLEPIKDHPIEESIDIVPATPTKPNSVIRITSPTKLLTGAIPLGELHPEDIATHKKEVAPSDKSRSESEESTGIISATPTKADPSAGSPFKLRTPDKLHGIHNLDVTATEDQSKGEPVESGKSWKSMVPPRLEEKQNVSTDDDGISLTASSISTSQTATPAFTDAVADGCETFDPEQPATLDTSLCSKSSASTQKRFSSQSPLPQSKRVRPDTQDTDISYVESTEQTQRNPKLNLPLVPLEISFVGETEQNRKRPKLTLPLIAEGHGVVEAERLAPPLEDCQTGIARACAPSANHTSRKAHVHAEKPLRTIQPPGNVKIFRICHSSLDKRQLEIMLSKFGRLVKESKCGFLVKDVSWDTTHLVVPKLINTPKLLKARYSGICVVGFPWVEESVEAGRVLPDVDFVLEPSRAPAYDLFQRSLFFVRKEDHDELNAAIVKDLLRFCHCEVADTFEEFISKNRSGQFARAIEVRSDVYKPVIVDGIVVTTTANVYAAIITRKISELIHGGEAAGF